MKIMVISEKPDACARIAVALDPGAVRRSIQGMPYWTGNIDGNTLIFASSLGHLYTLSTRVPIYPVRTYSWRPRTEVERLPRQLRESINMFMRGLAALDSDRPLRQRLRLRLGGKSHRLHGPASSSPREGPESEEDVLLHPDAPRPETSLPEATASGFCQC